MSDKVYNQKRFNDFYAGMLTAINEELELLREQRDIPSKEYDADYRSYRLRNLLHEIETIRELPIIPQPENVGDLYYIQNKGFCGNCLFWWAENGQGYTCDVRFAWKVDLEKAKAIVRLRPNIDFAWKVSEVDKVVVHHVDYLPSQQTADILPDNVAPAHLKQTANEAIDEIAAKKKRRK